MTLQLKMLLLAFEFLLLCDICSGFKFRTNINHAKLNSPLLMSAKANLLQIIQSKQHDQILVCPEYLSPLQKKTKYYGFVEDVNLVSEEYGTTYKIIRDSYIDLTVKSEIGKPLWALSQQERIGQNFFQNPFISGIYERGYRQNFESSGFPGIEKEFAEVSELFQAGNSSTILDISCGSGFMTRRFVKSGKYEVIFAADLSPTMLAETRRRFIEEKLQVPTLIRCDVARLPFQDASFQGIHAGAAMHCWPRLEKSLSEIFRVLSPGGVFYTSTFLTTAIWNPQSSGQSTTSTGFRLFTSTEEIAGLLRNAGFAGSDGDVVVRQEGRGCAIIKAVKGPLQPEKHSALLALFPSFATSTTSTTTADSTHSSNISNESFAVAASAAAVVTEAVVAEAVVTGAVVAEAVVTEAVVTEAVVTEAVATEAVVTEAVVAEAAVAAAVVAEAAVVEAASGSENDSAVASLTSTPTDVSKFDKGDDLDDTVSPAGTDADPSDG